MLLSSHALFLTTKTCPAFFYEALDYGFNKSREAGYLGPSDMQVLFVSGSYLI